MVKKKLETKIISGYDYQVRRVTERYLNDGYELIQAPCCVSGYTTKGWSQLSRSWIDERHETWQAIVRRK